MFPGSLRVLQNLAVTILMKCMAEDDGVGVKEARKLQEEVGEEERAVLDMRMILVFILL